PIDRTTERLAAYKAELQRLGRPYLPGTIGASRALQIVKTEAEREQAYALRAKVLQAIGGLARGPGAERYQNIGSHADPNLAGEESALLGTPEEICARLKKLEAGGGGCLLLLHPPGSQGGPRPVAPGRSPP